MLPSKKIQVDTLVLRDDVQVALEKIKDVENEIQLYKETKNVAGAVEVRDKLATLKVWVNKKKKDAKLRAAIEVQEANTKYVLGLLIPQGQGENKIAKRGKKPNLPPEQIKTLAELGITHHQSADYQKIASIPLEEFQNALRKHEEDIDRVTNELSTKGLIRLSDMLNNIEPQLRSDKLKAFDKEKLITLLSERKVTQYELAMGSGVECGTISRLVSGDADYPSFETIALIAEYFGDVQMEYFKTGQLL